jgi:hypothetical protein
MPSQRRGLFLRALCRVCAAGGALLVGRLRLWSAPGVQLMKPAILRDLARAVAKVTIRAGTLAAAAAAAPTAAQTTPPPKELRQACAADVQTLCAAVLPGGGRIKQCMIEKFDQLSDGCKGAMKDARAAQTGK